MNCISMQGQEAGTPRMHVHDTSQTTGLMSDHVPQDLRGSVLYRQQCRCVHGHAAHDEYVQAVLVECHLVLQLVLG